MFAKRRAELIPAYQDKNDKCPICRSERYMNANMKLLVGPCFHTMCDSCIDRLFAQGPAPCPVCHQILRKMAFVEPTFEDLSVEKEVRIRKRLAETFNKRPEDFATLKEYNDYLEDVEEITFNMINEVDIEATEARIKEFQKINQDVILANHAKAKREEKQFYLQMEQEMLERQHRREELQRERIEADQAHRREKEETLKALATSDESAAEILAKRAAISLKRSSMRRQGDTNSQASSSSTPKTTDRLVVSHDHYDQTEDQPFDPLDHLYEESSVQIQPHLYDDMFTKDMVNNVAARVGGWSATIVQQRALEDALSMLLVKPPIHDTDETTPMEL